MEIWLYYQEGASSKPADAIVISKDCLGPEWSKEQDLKSYSIDNGGVVDESGRVVGAFIFIEDEGGQEAAMEFVGLAEWLIIDCADWKMIPLENLVASTDGTATKIVASLSDVQQLQGAAFALQRGVDALLIPDDEEMWAVAQELAAQKLAEKSGVAETSAIIIGEVELCELEVTDIEMGGVGDRVCVDLIQMLEVGEGVLVGSSASLLALVHGETISSQFVPPRPFRINAGPVHSYIMMGDGTTKYLSELVAGDEVLVVSSSSSRVVPVGRLKIEPRPLLIVRYKDEEGNAGQAFLQQAETVRLVSNIEKPVSVTHITAGAQVIGFQSKLGRHIGKTISSDVEEK
ncbi:MAG: 3-dehydroquinate synthase II [Thermoplasmata archaeon]|nr:3-dehydroquinate synthase II [Thermoplasmata archaeon]